MKIAQPKHDNLPHDWRYWVGNLKFKPPLHLSCLATIGRKSSKTLIFVMPLSRTDLREKRVKWCLITFNIPLEYSYFPFSLWVFPMNTYLLMFLSMSLAVTRVSEVCSLNCVLALWQECMTLRELKVVIWTLMMMSFFPPKYFKSCNAGNNNILTGKKRVALLIINYYARHYHDYLNYFLLWMV